MFFTHDPWTRDASGMPERFAEELSPRKKKLHLPRNEGKIFGRGVSPQGNGNCEAGSETGTSYEFMHRAHRASTEGRKMGGSVGVWGTPCSIQRGLTRRLCILLVCTEALSVLAPKLQEAT